MKRSLDLQDDFDKTAFNKRAKASMREFLQAKSWVEKVASIERMNTAKRLAQDAMRAANADLTSVSERRDGGS